MLSTVHPVLPLLTKIRDRQMVKMGTNFVVQLLWRIFAVVYLTVRFIPTSTVPKQLPTFCKWRLYPYDKTYTRCCTTLAVTTERAKRPYRRDYKSEAKFCHRHPTLNAALIQFCGGALHIRGLSPVTFF